MKDRALYALPPMAPHGDLDRKKSSMPDDIEASELINEEFPDPLSFCYGEVRGSDELVWERFLEFKALLGEKGNRLCLERIFTTGPPERGGRSLLF